MQELEQAELIKLLESDGEPFVLFLHTPLCGTCKAAGRMLEVAAHLLPSGLRLIEGNVNVLPEIAAQYQIRSVPALLAVPGNREKLREPLYAFGSVERVLDYIRRGMIG